MSELSTECYWEKIGELKSHDGQLKFTELVKLVKTCLCLSHGNAEPERGFSENKHVLSGRERLSEETIIAIRTVKNNLNLYGSVENFPISRRLLDLCQDARKKYFIYLDLQKQQQQVSETKKKKNRRNES